MADTVINIYINYLNQDTANRSDYCVCVCVCVYIIYNLLNFLLSE
jgi:hypothetical protein